MKNANSNRRTFLDKTLKLGSLALLSSPLKGITAPDQKPLPSLEGRKILFTHGGWQGHEPKKFVDHLTPWLKDSGAEVSVFDSLEPYTDKDLMNEIDLVMQIFTMSSINEDQEKGLLEAVRENGTGMAGWHGGMCDAFRQNVEYQFMTGGQWVSHPGGVIDYEVNIVDDEDPVSRGLNDFPMKSEQYYMHVDPNMKVLATTRFNGDHAPWIDGCVMPVAWKKMYGKGRIFYTSVGHNLSHVTDVPDAIELIKRGVRWASASKYEKAEKWKFPVY